MIKSTKKKLFSLAVLCVLLYVIVYCMRSLNDDITSIPNDAVQQDKKAPLLRALSILEAVYDSINKAVEFIRHEHKNLNLDGLLGLRILQGQFEALNEKLDKGHFGLLSNDITVPLADIIEKTQVATELAIRVVRKTQADYFRREGLVLNKNLWRVHYAEKLTNHSLRQTQSFVGAFALNDPDKPECNEELLGTSEKFKSQRCVVSRECWTLMTAPGYRAYALTHQALYIYIGKMSGCFNKTLRATADHLLSTFCATMLQEAENIQEKQTASTGNLDLLMEQQTFCGILGYRDFFTKDLLEVILSKQFDEGCWGHKKDEPVFGDPEDKFHKGKRRRRKRESKTLAGGCDIHVTAMALGSLSQYVRYTISDIALNSHNTS